jgi:DNA-binding response OmpR family regulator
MVRLALRTHGFEVRVASHGEEALGLVKECEPDLIVLDLQMPVMDGRTFYRALRALGVQTPVVILSAFGARDAQAELHADAALNKPFEPDQLVELLRSLL